MRGRFHMCMRRPLGEVGGVQGPAQHHTPHVCGPQGKGRARPPFSHAPCLRERVPERVSRDGGPSPSPHTPRCSALRGRPRCSLLKFLDSKSEGSFQWQSERCGFQPDHLLPLPGVQRSKQEGSRMGEDLSPFPPCRAEFSRTQHGRGIRNLPRSSCSDRQWPEVRAGDQPVSNRPQSTEQ